MIIIENKIDKVTTIKKKEKKSYIIYTHTHVYTHKHRS